MKNVVKVIHVIKQRKEREVSVLKNTIVLTVTTVCFALICNFLCADEVLTKLDSTLLFMLIFLCVSSLLEKSSN